MRRLYTTPAAEPIVQEVFAARERWNQILTRGIRQEEIEQADKLLAHMAENALNYIRQEGLDREP